MTHHVLCAYTIHIIRISFKTESVAFHTFMKELQSWIKYTQDSSGCKRKARSREAFGRRREVGNYKQEGISRLGFSCF